MTTSLMLRTQDPASITVLRSARGAFCGKTFRADDSVEGFAIERPQPGLLWTPGVIAPKELNGLLGALKTIAGMGDAILIRGALNREVEGAERTRGVYRRMVDGGFADGVWRSWARTWVALDIDGAELDCDGTTWQAALAAKLPAPFGGVSFVWNRTASSGLKPGLRVRLFFLLSAPVEDGRLRRWASGVPRSLCIDVSLFNAVQPHYIANPRFEGLEDPCVGERWGLHQTAIDVADASLLLALLDDVDDSHRVGFVLDMLPPPNEQEIAKRVERIRRQEAKGARHAHALGAACELLGVGMPPELVEVEIEDLIQRQGREPDPGEAWRAVKHAVGKLRDGRLRMTQAPAATVLDAADAAPTADPAQAIRGDDILAEAPDQHAPLYGPNDLLNAGLYRAAKYPNGGFLRWAEQDWEWTGRSWQRLENDEVLIQRIQRDTGLKISRAVATARSFRSLMAYERLTTPCRLDGKPLGRVLIFRNGVLDLDSWLLDPAAPLEPHDANRFVTAALPYDYQPTAACPRFQAFLHQLWPDEADQRLEYQKMLGYLLLAENPLQRIFLLMGAPRSGKGTTLRLIRNLVGAENCCAPNLSSLASDFGLDSLIGRSVALVGEMNAQSNIPDEAIDRIKAISGGDAVPVNRKGKSELHIEMPVRFVIGCNQLPGFFDPSGALHARMVLFTMWRSFAGREDPNLDADLANELPGIAQFALAGLRRLLIEDGKFIQPESARGISEEYATAQAPMKAFLSTCVQPAPSGPPISKPALYAAYKAWAQERGHHVGSEAKLFLAMRHCWPQEWLRRREERGPVGADGSRPRLLRGFAFTADGLEYARANSIPNET